jgi:hypothetical protein
MLVSIPQTLSNVGHLIENSLEEIKTLLIEAEDRIKTSGAVNNEFFMNRNFVVETMKSVEKNIVDNMNLILYNFTHEKNDVVDDILAIKGHSWKATADIEACF